jgi:pilus assembly protein CpaF
LSEIAVLRAGEDGRVRATTAWHVDTGFAGGADPLSELIRARDRS